LALSQSITLNGTNGCQTGSFRVTVVYPRKASPSTPISRLDRRLCCWRAQPAGIYALPMNRRETLCAVMAVGKLRVRAQVDHKGLIVYSSCSRALIFKKRGEGRGFLDLACPVNIWSQQLDDVAWDQSVSLTRCRRRGQGAC
jgi:hypothetical protein